MFSSFGSPLSLWDRIQAWSSRPPHTLLVDSDLCGRRPRRMLSRLGGTDVKRRLDNRSRFHYGRKPPLDLDMDVVHAFFLALDMGAVHKLLPNCRLKDANPVPSRPHARSRRAARRRLNGVVKPICVAHDPQTRQPREIRPMTEPEKTPTPEKKLASLSQEKRAKHDITLACPSAI